MVIEELWIIEGPAWRVNLPGRWRIGQTRKKRAGDVARELTPVENNREKIDSSASRRTSIDRDGVIVVEFKCPSRRVRRSNCSAAQLDR